MDSRHWWLDETGFASFDREYVAQQPPPSCRSGLPKLCVADVSISNGSTISSEKVLGLSL